MALRRTVRTYLTLAPEALMTSAVRLVCSRRNASSSAGVLPTSEDSRLRDAETLRRELELAAGGDTRPIRSKYAYFYCYDELRY